MFLSTEQRHKYQTNTKTHIIKTKMKDNTINTMTGCISTDPRNMTIIKNRPNSKSNIDKDKYKNS